MENLPIKSISTEKPVLVLKVLYKAKLANPSKVDVLGDDDWKMLVSEIQKDYSSLTMEELDNIIMMGIKGRLDENNTQYSYVNFKVIYKWIDTWLRRNKRTRLNHKF